jgi:DNA-binding CsgD family transcriptional regulator
MRHDMTNGYATLTEKEKQTLRLIVRGHDAKSTARHLGLSVHTINERLRDARRKLAVSSSREAARMLLEREGATPDSVGDKQIGEAPGRQDEAQDGGPENGSGRTKRFALIGTGAAIMSLALGFLALIALPQAATAPEGGANSAEATSSAVAASAQDWLALVDQGRWQDSWAATAGSFRSLNTSQVWASLSQKVRVPLGAVQSRVLLSQDSVPAPPHGVEVLKFRTSFANKPNAVETVSLAEEDGRWRVVGYYIK